MRSEDSEKQMQMEIMARHIAEMEKQLEAAEENLKNIDSLKDDVKEFSSAKTGSEILAMFSRGIFIRANISENRSFIINAGEGTAVEKNAEEIIEILEKQKEEIKEIEKAMKEDIEKMNKELSMLE